MAIDTIPRTELLLSRGDLPDRRRTVASGAWSEIFLESCWTSMTCSTSASPLVDVEGHSSWKKRRVVKNPDAKHGAGRLTDT